MGQAFDKDGAILGETSGATKREVFDTLSRAHPDAAEIRIRTIAPSPSAEMPRYRCHKEVHALKIIGVNERGDGNLRLVVEPFYEPINVDAVWVFKHRPVVGGYYVVYNDGYASFSPSKAFEEGYTRVE